jgi:hypothetical protein
MRAKKEKSSLQTPAQGADLRSTLGNQSVQRLVKSLRPEILPGADVQRDQSAISRATSAHGYKHPPEGWAHHAQEEINYLFQEKARAADARDRRLAGMGPDDPYPGEKR